MEHEIGHAVGFADNDNPDSIMYYDLGSKNATLSSMDIAAARTLYDYGGPNPSATSAAQSSQVNAQWQRIAQAAAWFGAEHSGATGTGGTDVIVQPLHHHMTLAAGHA